MMLINVRSITVQAGIARRGKHEILGVGVQRTIDPARRHNRTETLDFVQSMLGQLRDMAMGERCDMVAYLIEMAYFEVSDVIRGERPLRADETLDRFIVSRKR